MTIRCLTSIDQRVDYPFPSPTEFGAQPYFLIPEAPQGDLSLARPQQCLELPSLQVDQQNIRPDIVENAGVVLVQLLQIKVDHLAPFDFILNHQSYIANFLPYVPRHKNEIAYFLLALLQPFPTETVLLEPCLGDSLLKLL